MNGFSYAALHQLFVEGELDVEGVGAFWGQATRVRLPQPVEGDVFSIPVTLHLAGRLEAVVYAQLLAGPGLEKLPRSKSAPTVIWSRRRWRRGAARTALGSFAIPDLGLHWQGETAEAGALALGAEFARILAEEFPDPPAELVRHFNVSAANLAAVMTEEDLLQAGTTVPVPQSPRGG